MEAAFQVKSTGPWGRESQGRGVRAGTVARGRGGGGAGQGVAGWKSKGQWRWGGAEPPS